MNDKKIIEYVLITGYKDFEKDVNWHLKNGYSLYGHTFTGIAKCNNSEAIGHDLYQAVVRYED